MEESQRLREKDKRTILDLSEAFPAEERSQKPYTDINRAALKAVALWKRTRREDRFLAPISEERFP